MQTWRQLSPELKERHQYQYVDWSAAPAMLGAILAGVERMRPTDSASVEELRTTLIAIGRTTETWFQPTVTHLALVTEVKQQRLDALREAMATAREGYCAYIAQLLVDDLRRMEPLPERRVLAVSEAERLWQHLEHRFRPIVGWDPRIAPPPVAHTAAFVESTFGRALLPEGLERILAEHRARRVWQLRSWWNHNQYEVELPLLREHRFPMAAYWTSEKMDWLLHRSTENWYTVSGEAFLNAVKKAWPEWQQYLVSRPG
jgi:hypothetical protein